MSKELRPEDGGYLIEQDDDPTETEGQEVLSDMTQVCGDIVAQIRNQTNIWDAPDTIALEYFTESDPDYLAGVRADVTLTLPLINDRCQVPIK